MESFANPPSLRDRSRTRQRIINATTELVEERSVGDVRVRDIAQRANVSASLVVQYFTSKDSLLRLIGFARLAAERPPAGSLHDILAWMVREDLAGPGLMRELMRQSWAWDAATETAFVRAQGPRAQALRAALGETGQDLGPILLATYTAELRRGLILDEPADAILERLNSALRVLQLALC